MSNNKDIKSGKTGWRSPSNIALVKYWGKKAGQIPANPSLSMTLSKAYTEMTMDFRIPEHDKPGVAFAFEGRREVRFETKITAFFELMTKQYPRISDFHFQISSHNTFPHSTGIASSASSMSALGLCLADFLNMTGDETLTLKDASGLSRLASGSACRSVYGGYVAWGKMEQMKGSAEEYAIPVPFRVHPLFSDIKDAILVVSSREKNVSSRAGHAMMDGHPYSAARYEMARQNMVLLIKALETGDFALFSTVTESEALNLHALMMSSGHAYILFEPNTINLIKETRRFRNETGIPVCFTLDAGPNVHLLYPSENDNVIKDWIKNVLVGFCENQHWIDDGIGKGPERVFTSIEH